MSAGALSAAKKDVLKKAQKCAMDASLCIAHCARELAAGNKSLAECNRKVQDLEIMCGTLAKVTARNNMSDKAYKSLVKAAQQTCEDCAAACKEHVKHHAECKNCYESCLDCIKACKKVA